MTRRIDRTIIRPPRGLVAFIGSFLVFAALSVTWAIATPISAAPDEPAHMIKAASVVRGQFIGEATPSGHVVDVPKYIAYTGPQAACYAFDADVSASCIPATPGDEAELVPALTTAGLYNPLYYLIVGWPTLVDDSASGIYLMRAASAVAVSLFLATSFALASRWRRPTIPLLGIAVVSTPMVLFLGGTVNPNSLEIAATLACFVAMMTAVNSDRRVGLPLLGAVIATSAAVAANTRGLSLLWVAIAIIGPLFLVKGAELLRLLRTRAITLAVIGTALASGFALYWVVTTSSLTASIDAPGEVTNAPGVGASSVTGFISTLTNTFDYGRGIVGVFGWLDTESPPYVHFVWSVFIGGALLAAVVTLRGRALWTAVGLVAALVIVPALIQGYYITEGGIIWQGRYTLPLFVIAIMAACCLLADRVTLPSLVRGRLVAVIMALWASAQLCAFATALRRYVVGLDMGWGGLASPEWSPVGGVPFVLAAFALALVAAVGGVLLVDRGSSRIDAGMAGAGPEPRQA